MRKSKITAPVGFNPATKPAKPATKPMQPRAGIIYRGPSLLDGAPIVAVAVYTDSNRKTGAVVQTYIIRADVDPMTASRMGEDYSICGDCQHRGTIAPEKTKGTAVGRTCYVALFQGPLQVYKALKAGKYPMLSLLDIQELGRGRFVRLGSYGDPACGPADAWRVLCSESLGHTGYTHQSKVAGVDVDYGLMMVSADSKLQAQGYHLNKKRTFRVIPLAEWESKGNASLLKNEVLCPASKEADKGVSCVECKLCKGTSIVANQKGYAQPKSIAIVAHGTNKRAIK